MDTFSSDFYQHHKFYNILISSPGKNDVLTLQIDRARCYRLRSNTAAF